MHGIDSGILSGIFSAVLPWFDMHTAHGDRWDLELEVEEGEVEEAGHAAVKSKGPHLARKEKNYNMY